jgi:hypothetical protein
MSFHLSVEIVLNILHVMKDTNRSVAVSESTCLITLQRPLRPRRPLYFERRQHPPHRTLPPASILKLGHEGASARLSARMVVGRLPHLGARLQFAVHSVQAVI